VPPLQTEDFHPPAPVEEGEADGVVIAAIELLHDRGLFLD
jgi:hypothetical protein